MTEPARSGWLLLPLLGTLCFCTTASAATIRGRVTNDDRQPIRRVAVTLESSASGTDTVTTNEKGRFRFENVEPGSYHLRVEKPRLVSEKLRVYVSEENADAEQEVNVVMRLTVLWQLLAHFQVGLLIYAGLFGLLVIGFNLWVVPEPSREVTVVGWGFIFGSVLVACVKALWVQATLLALFGLVLGGLIQRFGGRAAARRVREIERERDQHEAEQTQHKEKLAALRGKEGITLTDLKACGSASIDGEILDVRAADGFISKGSPIVVTRLEGRMPVVEVRPPSSPSPELADE
ncbi:MAG: carboxypeptidase-like regulatory domain-containing protein [Planctomycetota bacterium]|jgi:hypothetical protein